MEQGYFQIYTGNGKGKTTASLGLALRSLGSGYSVFIGQFLKSGDYSELKMLDKISSVLEPEQNLSVNQFGSGCFIFGDPTEEDYRLAREGFELCREALFSDKYDVIILDELNIALKYELIPLENVLSMIDNRPERCELIITGRYVHEELEKRADLITEMKEVRHYMSQGVMARRGIEK